MSFETVTIGPCTLIRGDCLEVFPTLAPGSVDAVVTDPPYGVKFNGKRRKSDSSRPITVGGYEDELGHVVSLITRVVEWSQAFCDRAALFASNRVGFLIPVPKSVGGIFSESCTVIDSWGFVTHQMVFFYGRSPSRRLCGGSLPNTVRIRPSKVDVEHPCAKPIEWMEWLVQRASIPGELVLDPFMGSGTTGVACIKTGRQFIGIEIEQKYFDIACERIRKAWKLERSKLRFEPQPVMRQQELIA